MSFEIAFVAPPDKESPSPDRMEQAVARLPHTTKEEDIKDCVWQYEYVNPETGEETRVDEEHHDVIILTDNGFIREYYHGSESDPCCYHFYTSVDQAP